MSLIKDYHDQHLTMLKRYWWKELINPRNLYRSIQWRHQRAERGWSDRDAWNADGHILPVLSGLLTRLGDEKSHVDWDEYFRANYKEVGGYNSLNDVAKDIDDYIAFEDTSWTDNLGFELKVNWEDEENGKRMVDKNTPKEQKIMKKAMKDWHKEWKVQDRKLRKALYFVANNIHGLWD